MVYHLITLKNHNSFRRSQGEAGCIVVDMATVDLLGICTKKRMNLFDDYKKKTTIGKVGVTEKRTKRFG